LIEDYAEKLNIKDQRNRKAKVRFMMLLMQEFVST
jgi:hypothetical protein